MLGAGGLGAQRIVGLLAGEGLKQETLLWAFSLPPLDLEWSCCSGLKQQGMGGQGYQRAALGSQGEHLEHSS